ncbi:MAG: TRAM domain-containing protein [Euryarchaeota archaeon]|nr:TRAM domain-containing protein [Euryarchaeota archaeon]
MKEGETYDVVISEVGNKGDGLTRVNNFVIFVPGTQKDERLKIRIREVRRTCAIGERAGEAGPAAEAAPAEPAGDEEEAPEGEEEKVEGGDDEEASGDEEEE